MFEWDFGDGSPVDNSISPAHTYATAGSYTATLTLTNSAGTSTSPGIPIQVNVDPNPKYYVRTTGGTGSTCGPKANPCSTITQAITNAGANSIHIIRVAGGSYTGAINMPANLEIVGGYLQNFSDLGPSEVTTIFGTGTAVPVTFNGVTGSKISGVSIQGVTRTSGDAIGVLLTGGSSNVAVGDVNSTQTLVSGGTGPNATGILITGGTLANVVNTKVNSGTTIGAGRSAYGLRVLGLSVVNVSLSDITAQPGIAGVSASSAVPGQATSGNGGGNGGNASTGSRRRWRRWRRRHHLRWRRRWRRRQLQRRRRHR